MLDQQTKIGAVTLKVANLEKMTAFYRDVMGLRIIRETAAEVALGTALDTWVILRQIDNGRYIGRSTGLFHLALRVPTRADLAHWLAHYAACDSPHWQGASDHGVSEALYLTDPEGNGIEIYHDLPVSEWSVRPDGQIEVYARPLDLGALFQQAPQRPWHGLPAETDMGHVHLRVNDMGAARSFYTDLLGFGIKTVYQESALFVAVGDYHHHIGLNTWQSLGAAVPPAEAYGLDQVAVELVTTAERDAVVTRLQEANHPILWQAGTPIVQDPSGNRLQLTVVA